MHESKFHQLFAEHGNFDCTCFPRHCTANAPPVQICPARIQLFAKQGKYEYTQSAKHGVVAYEVHLMSNIVI
jgi:hypothetical protein